MCLHVYRKVRKAVAKYDVIVKNYEPLDHQKCPSRNKQTVDGYNV